MFKGYIENLFYAKKGSINTKFRWSPYGPWGGKGSGGIFPKQPVNSSKGEPITPVSLGHTTRVYSSLILHTAIINYCMFEDIRDQAKAGAIDMGFFQISHVQNRFLVS